MSATPFASSKAFMSFGFHPRSTNPTNRSKDRPIPAKPASAAAKTTSSNGAELWLPSAKMSVFWSTDSPLLHHFFDSRRAYRQGGCPAIGARGAQEAGIGPLRNAVEQSTLTTLRRAQAPHARTRSGREVVPRARQQCQY